MYNYTCSSLHVYGVSRLLWRISPCMLHVHCVHVHPTCILWTCPFSEWTYMYSRMQQIRTAQHVVTAGTEPRGVVSCTFLVPLH